MSSSPAGPADFQQALDLFRAQFAQQLPARLAEVQQCLQDWRGEPSGTEGLRALHRVLHRLAGSAGTFGRPAFGQACREIELNLERLLARPARTGQDVEQVAHTIAQLQQVRG